MSAASVTVQAGISKLLIDPDSVTHVRRDVVSGQYEGGAKVWECTDDLIEYLRKAGGSSLAGMTCFDLGCGAGLLGIAAIGLGAALCGFQDYNAEVLEQITQSNILLNTGETAGELKTHLFGGSWESMAGVIEGKGGAGASPDTLAQLQAALSRYAGKVDLLLSSETIYNEEYYPSLCALTKLLLKPAAAEASSSTAGGAGAMEEEGGGRAEGSTSSSSPSSPRSSRGGRALFSAKRYYFGVGGGTFSFAHYAAGKGLTVRSVGAIEDGKSMTREILEVTLSG